MVATDAKPTLVQLLIDRSHSAYCDKIKSAQKKVLIMASKRSPVGSNAAKLVRQDALLDRCSRLYRRITDQNIGMLLRESFSVLTTVLETHDRAETLPPFLDIPFPKSLRDVQPPPSAPFTGSLEAECKLAFWRLKRHRRSLEGFLQLRRKFTRHVVLNEFSSAEAILNECQLTYGHSHWLIESKLLLAESAKGFRENRRVLTKFMNSEAPINAKFFASFASHKVEAGISLDTYLTSLIRNLQMLGYPEAPQVYSYLLVQTFPYVGLRGKPSEHEVAFIVRQNANAPLIDLYCSLMKLFRHLIFSGGLDYILGISADLREAFCSISDPEISPIASLLTPGKRPSFSSDHLDATYQLLQGDYHGAKAAAVQQLRDDPTIIDWYIILSKACAYGCIELPPVFAPGTRANEILEAMHRYHLFGSDCGIGVSALAKQSMTLDSTPMGYQIAGRWLETQSFSTDTIYCEAIHTQYGAPAMETIFGRGCSNPLSDHLLSEEYIEHPISKILKHFVSAVESAESYSTPSELADSFKCLNAGAVEFLRREYAAANQYFLSIPQQSNAFGADRLAWQFATLLQLARFDEAVDLVAEGLVFPTAVTKVIDLEIPILMYRQDAVIDRSRIGWPIVYFLQSMHRPHSVTRDEVFEVYANFMEAHGVQRPSQFGTAGVDRFGSKGFICFLRWICEPGIMSSDIEFFGTDDVENERVLICQLLNEIDPQFEVSTTEEISGLQQSRTMRKAIRHVVESKIYFDLEGIETELGHSFVERFERYKAVSSLEKESRVQAILKLISEIEKGGFAAVSISDASLVLFEELFEDVRKSFLFSDEHGLDSYLSVRIRHQAITGELRSVFESRVLVTEKDEISQRYVPNPAWNRFQDDSVSNDVQAALAQFSAAIDQTIDRVSNEWMRIHSDQEHPSGMFFFEFTPSELSDYHTRLQSAKNSEQFFDYIVIQLQHRLAASLETIRQKLESDLYEEFCASLDSLTHSLEAAATIPGELQSQIYKCRTDLESKLHEIGQWFMLQERIEVDDFPLELITSAAIDNISKCFPRSGFSCRTSGLTNLRVRGRCFAPLWDILFLVFQNVVNHALELCDTTTLSIHLNNNFLILTITNEIVEDAETLQLKLNSLQNMSSGIIRSEGGSGLAKLKKLIQHDMKVAESKVAVEVVLNSFRLQIELQASEVLV